jgi:hypothetical protein
VSPPRPGCRECRSVNRLAADESLGRLGWGFIIAFQQPGNRTDPVDILFGPPFRTGRPPEIRIQQSANYGLPLFLQIRIIVHCPVPLLFFQYNIGMVRHGAISPVTFKLTPLREQGRSPGLRESLVSPGFGRCLCYLPSEIRCRPSLVRTMPPKTSFA